MFKLVAFSPAFLLMLSATAGAAQRVYVKEPAVPAAAMDRDLDACVQQVLAFMNGPTSPFPRIRNPTTDQSILHAFDLRGPRAAAAAELKCMADKGYVSLLLDKDENKALAHSRGIPARDRWYDALVATDLSERIRASRAEADAMPK